MRNKGKGGWLLFVLLLCVSLFPGFEAAASEEAPVTPAEGWVQDGAGLLTESEEEKLEEKCRKILTEYGISTVIVTTDRFEGYDILDWERKLFAEQSLGAGEDGSSLILGISMAERDWGITAYGDAERIFGAYSKETIGGKILDDLSDGYYYDAFDTFLDMTDIFMADAGEGEIYSESNHYRERIHPAVIVLGAAALSFVVSLIVVLSWKKAMNTRILQNSAGAYLRRESVRLTNRSDIFLYHTVNRTKRQKQSSHSSGSMRSSGNGTKGKF